MWWHALVTSALATTESYGNATCNATFNTTTGMCCAGAAGILLPPFPCNTTAECCARCSNERNCSSWDLADANNTGAQAPMCTLRTTCDALKGNCTRGQLRPPPPPTPPPTPPPSPPPPHPEPPGGLSFKFVGTWRGVHKDTDAAVGDCTCSLIAREWVITAEHCATRVLKHEKVKVRVNFHGDSPHVERGVTHCIRPEGGADVDIAICHLTAKVGAFPPVTVNSEVMKTGHGPVEVLTVGTMGGLHHPKKRLEYESNGAHLYVKKGGGMKAGDSGGPWLQQADGGHFLVGVLHGSGIAGQTSHIRAFLDRHIEGIRWDKP